jgi:hypothetical protein
MNEKIKPAELNGATLARGCERASDLLAYLYGEADPAEAQTFRTHLNDCVVCRDELAAFGDVREAFGEWRKETLSIPFALDLHEAFAPMSRTPSPSARKRSASAALREFFSLSPLWLKAGAFAATLMVCALAALTLARAEVRWDANGLAFRPGATVEKRVEVPVANGFTPEQVEEIVKHRLELAQVEWESKQQQTTVVEVNESRTKSAPQLETASNTATPRRRRAAPRATRRDEQTFEDEDSLPRLSDLLGGAY